MNAKRIDKVLDYRILAFFQVVASSPKLSTVLVYVIKIACKDSASRAKCQIYLSISKAPPILAEGNVVQAERNAKFCASRMP